MKRTLNTTINRSKSEKNDEHYTLLADIENEVRHYRDQFRGMTVLCNCDDPRCCNFFKYFTWSFEILGLKRVIATCHKSQDVDLFTQKSCEKAVYQIYAYTANGRRTRTTWARGVWKENAYNERNLLGGVTYSDAATPSVAYAYADSGRVASAALSDGTAYAYGYDDRLLNTNETVSIGQELFSLVRTFDAFRRNEATAVVVTNVQHAAKVRHYDSEDRVCGYSLTNAAGRSVSVAMAYDGSYLTNMAYSLPNGKTLSVALARKASRRELVSRRDYSFNGQSVYWYATDYDLLGRPTNATDSVSLSRGWRYNSRSELAAATLGTNLYGYTYDTIGNRQWSAANSATNEYSANSLNQYTMVGRTAPGAPPAELYYDADGNLEWDDSFAYSYDAENRLTMVSPVYETNGVVRVINAYDHSNRRMRKIVQRLSVSVAPAPSPPIETRVWNTVETHTFVWDANNIVLEKVEFANGTTRMFEYFWGLDKSGTEQGAGGVGGLLAMSVDGVFYIPCYDHNGNIVLYVSETGVPAAQYVYDSYGNIVEMSGPLADVFSFGFSTKYHDREIGIIGYQQRFYRPDFGRWHNRDPIGEEGGANLYAFCDNNAIVNCDKDGCAYFAYRPLDSFLFKWFVWGTEQDDIDNTMLAHEQLFFEDGGIPTNLGFFDDNQVRSDTAGISYRQPHSTGWDDCIMRKAVQLVRPRKYKLLDIDRHNQGRQYNCQDWAEDVRRAYSCIKQNIPYYPQSTAFMGGK